MSEKEYRLYRLKQSKKLENKRVILYGTGKNTQYIIENYPEINILGLMDENQTGKIFFGKRVLSEQQVLELRPDIIVMAAEHSSAQSIYKRIMPFCVQYHIELLDMYGKDEIELHKTILEQEIQYLNKNAESLRNAIDEHDSICFELFGTLCEKNFFDNEGLFEKIDFENKKAGFSDSFISNRKLAESKIAEVKKRYTLADIYYVYQFLPGVSPDAAKRFLKMETEVFFDSVRPRTEMVEILKYAQQKGKHISVYSDILEYDNIKTILSRLGIEENHTVLSEVAGSYMGVSQGLLREEIEKYPEKKFLYVGTSSNETILLPLIYGQSAFLIKSSWDMFLNFTSYKIDKQEWDKQPDKTVFTDLIIKEYNSPFCLCITGNNTAKGNKDLPTENFMLLKKILVNKNQDSKIPIRAPYLYPIEEWDQIDSYDKLSFPACENPLVSIIIPAHNQFAYTYSCLKSILKTVFDVPYEIILADDCSTDLTREVDEILENVNIIHHSEKQNFLMNCNGAAKSAWGKYILFLNNDTQVQPNWLPPLVNLLENNAKAGMTGSKLLFPDGRLQEAGGMIFRDGSATNYGFGMSPDLPEYNYVRNADYISGAAVLIRKDLWETVGGFDERYYPAYCEDSDLAFEVRKHGMEVLYQPESAVVHFGGVSHGNNLSQGIKAYQVVNQKKFLDKWRTEIEENQIIRGFHTISARDRKLNRKTVLFISEHLPRFDKDAGSRTIFYYMKLFLKRGYIVKFIPADFRKEEPYTYVLQQMGIEVLYGEQYKDTIMDWLQKNQLGIEYAFLNYPGCSVEYLRMLQKTSIKTRYYGMDLHFLRLQREYQLKQDEELKKRADFYYKIERELIKNSDVVYYPSKVETELIADIFHDDKAKVIKINFFDNIPENDFYHPKGRSGLLFVGGFSHSPNVDAMLWFLDEIYPLIYAKEKIDFFIVGSSMPPEIQQIEHPGVIIKGFLSDDELDSLYETVKMVVIPLRYGAGMKGKVLEAMYRGIPLVTTSIGAEGMEEAEKVLNIQDKPDEFAESVLELYNNIDLLSETSNKYLQYVRKYCSEDLAWSIIKEDF